MNLSNLTKDLECKRRGLDSKVLDSHMVFLTNYAKKYGIVFRVTRKTCSIEVLDKGDTPD